jgi:hypothetical protein
MGWYSFVPFMECKHGILVMDGGARGVTGDGRDITGRIYVEKDYGRSFPQGWVWAQSNSFPEEGVSVSCSVARVPFLGGAFTGFLIGFLIDGRVYRFTTYTGAKISQLSASAERAEITVSDAKHELTLACTRKKGSILASPASGEMIALLM